MTHVVKRVKAVRETRLESPTKSVRDAASLPYLFSQDRQPATRYLAVPEVSSQARRYIPATFLEPDVIASNKLQIVVGATTYHFAIISSEMHMAWVREVSGRLKSDYSYSPAVYNNYPWPSPKPDHRKTIEELGQAVLDARASHPASSLGHLYDPTFMPADLLDAHQRLDRAVERCYRPEPFTSDRERVEFLFTLYEQLTAQLTAPLLPAPTPRRRRRAV